MLPPTSSQKGKEPMAPPANSAPSASALSAPPFMQSPNAIPPRRSSTAQQAQYHHHRQQSTRDPSPPAAASSSSAPAHRPRGHQHAASASTSASTSTSMPTSTDALKASGLAQFFAAAAPATLPTALPPMPPPAPPPDPARYATEDFNFSARHAWTEDKERVVCGPFDYLNSTRGKEFRTQLISAFNGWLGVPADSLEIITHVVGMLHTASLLVDDVEDGSSLRRGLPVAHNIFGVAQTINSANYIYFVALQELQKLKNPRALAVFAEELCNLHRGQGMDLFWRDTLTCPSEDDYLEMVGHKTGGLFRLGIKLMQAESASAVDCVPLVNLLGLLFQIQDDYRNLMAREYSENKGMCEDLTEGKFSFPVIHSIRSNPSNLQLLNILKQKTADEEVKRFAVAYMEHTGSFAYTRQVLEILAARARSLADALDEGQGRARAIHAILDKLSIR